ncbi:MAG: MBL fold metallo-hydrolase [Gemmatales bacterium]|nr:MBL fold metallo-hydrolase [Gemmatales bacterium]MDW8385578.1 MBL fold metallo-hydrolase [Gemmatales bacterium]
MARKLLCLTFTAILAVGLTALGRWAEGRRHGEGRWVEIAPGVLRSPGLPAAHALIAEGKTLLIDAPVAADPVEVARQGLGPVEMVLLTHHHRDTAARVGDWLATGAKVRAPKASAEWLHPEGVSRYWRESLPLRTSRTAYLVVARGWPDVACDVEPGREIVWRNWRITPLFAPGHSPDHVAYLAVDARLGDASPRILFAGDALAQPGKIWSPYTTDWDHWTDLGLKPAAESLRKLAEAKPTMICPAHGSPITEQTIEALRETAQRVEEAGFLKSYERFTKERLGNPPSYAFLAKEQAGSAGEKPWSQLSEHLFYTGNTYVLVARDRSLMVFDPWGRRSVEQIRKLQAEHGFGPVELVMFSHAHYDHYDGVYDLADRDRFQVWALDLVAMPIAEPLRFRAPFLDARPVRFERRFRDGASANWKEYTFRFHHFPGQTYYTMAVETTIDGKRCLFTGDNYFHVDLYSGTGGWMGLNRSWPHTYRVSAAKLLELRPEWVLAEHGGAFEFNEEDVRRRIRWAEAAAQAVDALSPSGDALVDWDPHLIHFDPLVVQCQSGDNVTARLVVGSVHGKQPPPFTLERLPGTTEEAKWFRVRLPTGIMGLLHVEVDRSTPPGRHVIPFRAVTGDGTEVGADVFIVLDVASR